MRSSSRLTLLYAALCLSLTASPPVMAQATDPDVQFVSDCALDEMPHEAAAICAGKLMESCMEGVTENHAKASVDCWTREEIAWLKWTAEVADETIARVSQEDPSIGERVEEAWQFGANYRHALCSLQQTIWPGDEGLLMDGRCGVQLAARQAVDLYWLGRP